MLAADADLAADVTGVWFLDAVVDRATGSGSTRNAGVGRRSGTAAELVRATAEIGLSARTEIGDRAAEVLAVAMTGTAGVVAAFGVVGISWHEMGMTALVAADFAACGVGEVRADVAASVFFGADPGADSVLAAGLGFRVETAAFRVDQRLETNVILGRP